MGAKLTFFFLHQVQPSAYGTVRRRFAAGSGEGHEACSCSGGPRILEIDQGWAGGGGMGGTVAITPSAGAAGVFLGWSAIANERMSDNRRLTLTCGSSNLPPSCCPVLNRRHTHRTYIRVQQEQAPILWPACLRANQNQVKKERQRDRQRKKKNGYLRKRRRKKRKKWERERERRGRVSSGRQQPVYHK